MFESVSLSKSGLHTVDWAIIIGYLVLTLTIGLILTRRAGKSVGSYYVSNRNLTWWLLGTSMVATTFAADTPLAVTGWVRTEGIWKNWFWWNYIFSHVFIVFVFARLWRRAEVITDNELIEMRYSGKPAAFLRGFKAFYFSTIFNFVVMGWVITAMSKVFKVFFGIEQVYAVIFCLSVALIYTMLSGLWGVVITDFIQYIIALIGTILLAYFVINSDSVGGYSGFIEKLNNIDENHLSFFIIPEGDLSSDFLSSNFFTFIIFFTVIWWSSHNADGGGYFIQRISSAKNEKHAILGMAWFALNHYVIRFWPWVVIAVASLIVFPDSQVTSGDNEAVYVLMIKEFLSPGLMGLLLVTFLAAFMSTISTQLNWGSSYLLNDIYMRFIKKNATEKHYVAVSRILTMILATVAGFVAFQIKNIGDAWIFLWAMSSGIGLVLILRWFWWRINAWSEIVALASSLFIITLIVVYTAANNIPLELKHQVLVVPVSIISWIFATFVTKPEPIEKLTVFYRKVLPWGFWKPVSMGSGVNSPSFFLVFVNWVLGVIFLILSMVGIGKLILGKASLGIILIFIALIFGWFLYVRFKKEFSV